MINETTQDNLQAELENAIVTDTFDVLGFIRFPVLSRLMEPVFRPVVRRISKIVAQFEIDVAENGFKGATQTLLPRFVEDAVADGLETLPAKGPLILASNHPAAYDAFILASLLPRDDLKILATDIQILERLPSTAGHFIFIGPASQPDTHLRMSAVRESIRHLRSGGAILIFPSGKVDPDPAVSSGAEDALQRWHSGLELLMRRVPDSRIVLTIVSGVLTSRWLNSPVTRLRKEPHNRQKVAEIFQVLQQLFFPGRLTISPRVSFAHPIKIGEIDKTGGGYEILPSLTSQAAKLLRNHENLYYPT